MRELFNALHSWLYEAVVQPVLFRWELMGWAELAYEWSELFLLGAIEVAVLWALLRPLEALFPVERWEDRAETRVDVVYTLLARLGILPIFFFIVLQPAVDAVHAALRLRDVIPPNLEDLLPVLRDRPWLSLLAYAVAFDFLDYWRHRGEHTYRRWWALHAVHHSQRQMTFWSDEREHLLGQAVAALLRAGFAVAIGVPAADFLMVTLAAGAIESLSHANIRMSFGRIGDRLLVSPLYHRTHHARHVNTATNLATLFPVWDILFGTADFSRTYPATGIDDDREYGRGFWRQQWLGVTRLFAKVEAGDR
ncbi:MAG: sterol desaturase family protein [Acidobacteriaceae bacterium]|jgi:sterol desaturase/sphingolipid hydroxylase (fatty acid hydroxylase superfamily)|nr:sterol desaturase family protein [Acidobacteriaceae bacterium]